MCSTRQAPHRSRVAPFVQGFHLLWRAIPGDFERRRTRPSDTRKTTIRAASRRRDYKFGLFRLRSPLLTESLLFSFPGLINMLKFGPFSRKRWWIDVKRVLRRAAMARARARRETLASEEFSAQVRSRRRTHAARPTNK